MQSLICR